MAPAVDSPDDLEMRMTEFLVQRLQGFKCARFDRDVRLAQDAGLSSLALVQIVTAACSEFGVDAYSLSAREFANASTLGELASLLASKAARSP